MKKARALEKRLLASPHPKVAPVKRLSSGSILTNLAMTGRPDAAFETSCYYLLVGGSRSGKTYLTLTSLAEASVNPAFDKYDLVVYEPERGARMDIKKYFGSKLASRLKRRHPTTHEEFYDELEDRMLKGPVIAVLDSETGLVPRAAMKKHKANKAARAGGDGEEKGSYGIDAARLNSDKLKIINAALPKHGSILLMIIQSRQRIGFGASLNPHTRAGGLAPTFYATGEAWFSIKGSIRRTVRGLKRKIGSQLLVKVKKNRDTGREPEVLLHHYPSHGLDDIGAMIHFLVLEKHWEGDLKKITEGDFNARVVAKDWKLPEMSLEKLAQHVQDKGLETDLRSIVRDVWDEIESACRVERKPRYV